MKKIDLSKKEEINTVLEELKEENNGNRDKPTMLELANKLLRTIETDLGDVYTMQMDEELECVFSFYRPMWYDENDIDPKCVRLKQNAIEISFSGTYLDIEKQVNKILEINKGVVATLKEIIGQS